MSSFEAFVEDINQVTSPEAAFDVFRRTIARFGFDRIVYTFITDHASVGKPAGHGVLGNYPEDFMQHYRERDYLYVDPVCRRAASDVAPFTWSEIEETTSLSAASTRVMREAGDAGLRDGVGIPIHNAYGEIAGVGLANAIGGLKPDRKMLHMLRAYALQFDLVYGELTGGAVPPQAPVLTAREREILLWVAEGKSDSVVGDILGISTDTVKYHLKNIYRKLEVNERTLAVVKAIRVGLIVPSAIRSTSPGR